MNCAKCLYWEDYKDRVWAVISGKDGERNDGSIELRACKYSPSPTIGMQRHTIYTDRDFVCSEWRTRHNN